MQDSSLPDQTPEQSAAHAPAGMTPEQLAEARQYGRYSLACTLADKLLDVAYLTVATFVLARPLDAWLQTRLAAAGPLGLAAARRALFAHHGVAHGRVAAAGILLGARPGASLPSQQSHARRLDRTLSEAERTGACLRHGFDLGTLLVDLDDGAVVVADGGRNLLLRHDHPRKDLSFAHYAAVLQDRAARTRPNWPSG